MKMKENNDISIYILRDWCHYFVGFSCYWDFDIYHRQNLPSLFLSKRSGFHDNNQLKGTRLENGVTNKKNGVNNKITFLSK